MIFGQEMLDYAGAQAQSSPIPCQCPDETSDGSMVDCWRPAEWAAVARCPVDHLNTDLTCTPHKKAIEQMKAMFKCNACGIVTPANPPTWRKL